MPDMMLVIVEKCKTLRSNSIPICTLLQPPYSMLLERITYLMRYIKERVNFVLGKWQDFKFNVEDTENK